MENFPFRGLRNLSGILLLAVSGTAWTAPITNILIDQDGVCRVSDRALIDSGRRFQDNEIARLALHLRGAEIPLLVTKLPAGSPEGRFSLEFTGEFARGEKTYLNEYTSSNVYRLDPLPDGQSPKRIRSATSTLASRNVSAAEASVFTAHHELNKKLIRFSGSEIHDESWFWTVVSGTDEGPTSVDIQADSVAPQGSFTLRVGLFGYSHLPANPDHGIDVSFNGKALGKAVWDGEVAYVFERTLDQALLHEGGNSLTLRAKGEATAGIDLALLDWVELSYSRRHDLSQRGQVSVSALPGSTVKIRSAQPVTLFDVSGASALSAPSRNGFAEVQLPSLESNRAPATPVRWTAVRDGSALPPRAISTSEGRDLKNASLGADLIIVSHERFLKASERLALARRAEGLKVAVVAVQDVYDNFRHGFIHPEALRDFLLYANRSWKVKPRYVLFVGDASWDYNNTVVSDADYTDWNWWPENPWGKNGSNVAGKTNLRNDRLFIPTHQYQSPWGHAACDNYFVSEGGDAGSALMAIGRLPVATEAEADATIDKILAYDRLAPGSLKNALFITNDEQGFQLQTDSLVELAKREGYTTHKVYPKHEQMDNVENTKALLEQFDAGQAVAIFYGHGGRYIWRTGPPDLKKNHDLFTLEHLDQLQATTGMPVVVSLTCYSAPFDHPVADSIGEKFLRISGRGAIAVIASTWRNSPPIQLGQKLLELLGTNDHPRIGDAYLASKRGTDPITAATYVLLGDPSTPFKGLRQSDRPASSTQKATAAVPEAGKTESTK
ncbi:MAG: C25 family cysteine peptidase [Thermoanaerobaculia bacterium]